MKNRVMQWFIAASVLATASSWLRADVVELTDGRRINGTLARQGDRMVIHGDDGVATTVTQSQIVRVKLTSAPTAATSADGAKAGWTRTSAEIKKAETLATVIDLYQRFLAKYPEGPVAQAATESLREYQKLAEDGATKLHGKWMTSTQAEVMRKQWADDARSAVNDYKAGRKKEALEGAKGVLAKAPENPVALTVAGLAAYQANVLPLARRYFVTLGELEPRSILAANNLAVIAHQQKQEGESIALYVKALEVDSSNRMVLDNVTEAVSAYGKAGGDPKSSVFQKLSSMYAAAEMKMEVELGKQGLRRYGSTWATKDELDAANRNLQSIRAQMDLLNSQYRASKEALMGMEARLRQANTDYENAALHLQAANTTLASQAQANLPIRINNGAGVYSSSSLIERGLAVQDFDRASRQKAAVEAQREVILSRASAFDSQAETLKAMLTAADPLSGEQRMIDVDAQVLPPKPLPTVHAVPTAIPEPTVRPAPATMPSNGAIFRGAADRARLQALDPNASASASDYDRPSEPVERPLRSAAPLPGRHSPVVFALPGNGPLPQQDVAELVDTKARVKFDIMGDGVAREWPWVKPGTALLVWDPQSTGEITAARQLFGTATWSMKWRDGYEALALLDDNRDGVLSGAELEGIRVWVDANGNGISEAGEVKDLAELKITEIGTRSTTGADGTPTVERGVVMPEAVIRTFDWFTEPRVAR